MTNETTATRPQASDSPRRIRWGRWLILGAVSGFLALVGFGVYRAQAGQVAHGPAPDFTLELYDGETFRLSDQRGKVVMVDFPWHRPPGQVWASWCIPCRQEARALEALWQEYRERGVVFVGVAYVDTDTEARAFLDEFGITYPNGLDLGTRMSQAYRIRGVPEKFFIDRHGQVRGLVIGPVPEAELRQRIEALLAEP